MLQKRIYCTKLDSEFLKPTAYTKKIPSRHITPFRLWTLNTDNYMEASLIWRTDIQPEERRPLITGWFLEVEVKGD